MMKSLGFVLIFVFFTLCSCLASEENQAADAEFYFLFGYHQFIHREFKSAQESFHHAVKVSQEDEIRDQSRLYEALAQAKLKKNKDAAKTSAEITESNLEPKNQHIFSRLKKFLGQDYNEAVKAKIETEEKKSKIKIAFSPSVLSTSFGSESPRETSLQFGADLKLSRPRWNFSLFGSSSSHAFKTTSFNYDQKSLNFSYQRLGASFDWGAHTGFIKSATPSQNASHFGLMTKYHLLQNLDLGFDYTLSSYPQSDLEALSVNQGSFLVDFWFLRSSESEVKLSFNSLTIKPTSPMIQNDASFIDNKFYQSFFIELYARIESFHVRSYYWSGEEVFATRYEGRQVFTYPEIHTGGLGTTLSFEINDQDMLHLSYLQEDIKMQTKRSQSSSLMATYDYFFE